jgi:predicted CoA-binding protein
MKTVAGVVRWTLVIAGVLSVALGLLVWPGNVAAVAGLHSTAGFVAIVATWGLAGIAARARLGRRIVALAVGLGVAIWALAAMHYVLLPGSVHWFIVLPHAFVGIGTVAWGARVLARVSHEAAEGASTGQTIKEAATEFLAYKRIAVTGVSRKPDSHGSNIVYRRLRERGYQVFAVNPHASMVEGDRSYSDLSSIPDGVDAVVIGTRPSNAMSTMRECADLGIKHVWMHRSVGTGSVSEEAAAWGRQRGIRVIAGGCPLMFDPVADGGHKVMRSLFTLTGKVPRRV